MFTQTSLLNSDLTEILKCHVSAFWKGLTQNALINNLLIITIPEMTVNCAAGTSPLTEVEFLPWAASLPELMGATLQRVCWKAASTCKLPLP